jgi:hypothetical protein
MLVEEIIIADLDVRGHEFGGAGVRAAEQYYSPAA